ncbi:hypothetical protein GNP79_06945 [Aliivibrio fischeri]|uniref:Uncharacterized protein n=1 Tax=Aliivibrio fischeri TaxID=668 RepID=A0A6N3YZP8_ALIFS|nr:hypothetical protein [Aliivibrio fischeri]MUK44881.1 hypothetical protein [Aliivibrio fischeri]MUK80540.1 hypothetical protein [Aliivibrio fischeri]MUK84451.1 hypothetical protein [Aliivibrio fischeri]
MFSTLKEIYKLDITWLRVFDNFKSAIPFARKVKGKVYTLKHYAEYILNADYIPDDNTKVVVIFCTYSLDPETHKELKELFDNQIKAEEEKHRKKQAEIDYYRYWKDDNPYEPSQWGSVHDDD